MREQELGGGVWKGVLECITPGPYLTFYYLMLRDYQQEEPILVGYLFVTFFKDCFKGMLLRVLMCEPLFCTSFSLTSTE